MAEGIAVKSPGALTMELINRHVDDVVLVNEEFIERAIFNLLEIEKTRGRRRGRGWTRRGAAISASVSATGASGCRCAAATST